MSEAAARYGFERWTTTWEDLVADPSIGLFDNLGLSLARFGDWPERLQQRGQQMLFVAIDGNAASSRMMRPPGRTIFRRKYRSTKTS